MDKEKKLIRLVLLVIFEIAYNLQKQLGYVKFVLSLSLEYS